MKKQKNFKNQRGITLVALIITIIVLVILAAVAINVALNTGIINFASKGVTDYAKAGVDENRVMNKTIDFMTNTVDKIEGILGETGGSGGTSTGGNEPKTLADAMNKKYEFKKNKTYKEGEKSITIPAGFHIVGPEEDKTVDYGTDQKPNIEEGIVIEDGAGNQFVWIPVSKDGKELERTNWDSSGNPSETVGDGSYANVKDCSETYSPGYIYEKDGKEITEAQDFNEMITQVTAYQGFYIGRYETGVDNNTLRKASSEAQKIVSKAGVAPYNYVKWGDSMESIGTRGAVYLAKNKYEDNPGSVTSTLVYGCEWDAMCRFIGPKGASTTTPRKSAPGLTGSVPTDKVKNIYDLAGNCMEWTMEAYKNTNRAFRSGNFGYSEPISFRSGSYTALSSEVDGHGFRLSLYISNTKI